MCHVFVTPPALIGLSGSVNLPPVAEVFAAISEPGHPGRTDYWWDALDGRRWESRSPFSALDRRSTRCPARHPLRAAPFGDRSAGSHLQQSRAEQPRGAGIVGETLARLAARSSSSSPAQVYPTPDPNNGVRVIYAPDARGPLPPAVTVPALRRPQTSPATPARTRYSAPRPRPLTPRAPPPRTWWVPLGQGITPAAPGAVSSAAAPSAPGAVNSARGPDTPRACSRKTSQQSPIRLGSRPQRYGDGRRWAAASHRGDC